jgi:hypothetical protein
VLEVANLGMGLLQVLQLTQLSSLQHLSSAGCCQQCSSSWSITLNGPQLQQV